MKTKRNSSIYFFASWLTSTKFFFSIMHFFSCILVLMLLTVPFTIYRKFPNSQCYTMFLLLLFLPFTNVLLSFCISIGCGITSKYNGRIPLCTQHPKAIQSVQQERNYRPCYWVEATLVPYPLPLLPAACNKPTCMVCLDPSTSRNQCFNLIKI